MMQIDRKQWTYILWAGLLVCTLFFCCRTARQQYLDQALLSAIKRQDTPRTTALLEQGAHADAEYPRGIHDPVQMFNEFMCGLDGRPLQSPHTLLTLYKDVSWDSGFTPLVPPENVPLVKVLLDHGANPNASLHLTLLEMAVMSHHVTTARLLIEHGARDDLSALLRRTVSQNDTPMAQMLLDKGANVNAADKQGATALFYMFVRPPRNYDIIPGSGTPMAHLLLKHGAKVNIKDNSGKTALDYARECNDYGQGRVKNIVPLLE